MSNVIAHVQGSVDVPINRRGKEQKLSYPNPDRPMLWQNNMNIITKGIIIHSFLIGRNASYISFHLK